MERDNIKESLKVQEIVIDNVLLSHADKEANKRMAAGFRGSHTDSYKKTMILVACIGEFAVQKYLENNKIDYIAKDEAMKGRCLIIKGKEFEIHTSGYSVSYEHLNLLYNKQQYEESVTQSINFVLQVFINGYNSKDYCIDLNRCNKAIVAGYVPFKDIARFPVLPNTRRPNYKIGLSELLSFEEFIDK